MSEEKQYQAWVGKKTLRVFLLSVSLSISACQSVNVSVQQAALKSLRDEKNYAKIPPGAFLMGLAVAEPAAGNSLQELPQHRVVLTRAFEIGRHEVTQRQWEAVMSSNPSAFKGSELPVTNVSWKDVQEFLARVNKLDAQFTWRLPTEAEWEYACRAGSDDQPLLETAAAKESQAAFETNLRRQAWYEANSLNRPHAVGQLQPNAWGLYDIQGNVWEWVGDWYDINYYRRSPAEDPQGPPSGQSKVQRGGSWQSPARHCGAAVRGFSLPVERNNMTGFRLVRVPH